MKSVSLIYLYPCPKKACSRAQLNIRRLNVKTYHVRYIISLPKVVWVRASLNIWDVTILLVDAESADLFVSVYASDLLTFLCLHGW